MSELSACIRRVHDPLAEKIAERLGRAAAERAKARPATETRDREFVGETEFAVVGYCGENCSPLTIVTISPS